MKLPFDDDNLKRMRIFYEEWSELDAEIIDYNSSIQTDELLESKSSIQTDELEKGVQVTQNQTVINSFIQTNEIQILPFNFPSIDAFPGNDFRSIGFTHHTNILIGDQSGPDRQRKKAIT